MTGNLSALSHQEPNCYLDRKMNGQRSILLRSVSSVTGSDINNQSVYFLGAAVGIAQNWLNCDIERT